MSQITPNRTWASYAAETLVIMLSILLALFVDAAWDSFQDRRSEGDYLADLTEEFRYAAGELQRDQARRREMLEILQSFIDAEISVTPSLLNALLDYRAFNPSHPVFEDLVGSGNFQLLENENLRIALLRYQQDVDRLEIGELRDREFVSDRVEPYLLESIDLAGISEMEEMDRRSLSEDVRFKNLVSLRWQRLETAIRFGGFVEASIQRVLDQVVTASE